MFAKRDLTQGSIPRGLLGFALPLILGNLLQQLYNLADTWVVGRFIGEGALAAVGSSYTLMTFLTSILLGRRGFATLSLENEREQNRPDIPVGKEPYHVRTDPYSKIL